MCIFDCNGFSTTGDKTTIINKPKIENWKPDPFFFFKSLTSSESFSNCKDKASEVREWKIRTSDNKRQRRPWNSKRSLSVASAYELFGFFYELELKWFWRQKETRETGRGRGLLWLVLSVSPVIPASFFSTSTLLSPRPDSLLLLSQHPLLQCDWRISYLFSSCWVIVFVPLALRWNICVFPSLSLHPSANPFYSSRIP